VTTVLRTGHILYTAQKREIIYDHLNKVYLFSI